MDENEKQEPKPVWCIAANVVAECPFGPGGEETRSGTKHFAPGAKVHVVAFFWGMGGEDVTVVGRHRKSLRFIIIVIKSKLLVNWRAELVYSPHVIQEVLAHEAYKPDPEWFERIKMSFLLGTSKEKKNDWGSSQGAKEKAERIAASYQGPTQPPTTRPPQPK